MRQVCAPFNKSANRSTRLIFVVYVVVIVLVIFATNVPSARAAPLSSSMRDGCGHTLRRPSSFFRRHFDSTFLRNFVRHLIPFTSATRVRMQFFVYKKDFAECGREIITDDDGTLEMSEFNPEHPTRIIIHGWMSQSKGALTRLVKKAYLSLVKSVPQPSANDSVGGLFVESAENNDINTVRSRTLNNNFDDNNNNNVENDQSDVNITSTSTPNDFNVIICDWSVISSNVNYFGVVEMVEDLGHLLAEFVNFLHLRTGLNYNDVYLIGHSMGAQIAGSAGKQAYPFRFNTIYALDPAGPKFRDQSPEYRIDASDAEYVESIQTSSSLGFEQPVGHATFYPNYGHDQKKCYFYGCSHKRVYHYFAESITSNLGFWGVPCRRQSNNLWIFTDAGAEFRMGGEPSTPKNGTFYVKTAAQPPYALGPTIQPQRLVTPAVDDVSHEKRYDVISQLHDFEAA